MTSLRDWLPEEIPEPIMEDAARWMALLDSERCQENDRTAFALWLDEDPRHRWAFEELSEVWARLRTLRDVKPLLEQPNVRRLPSSRPAAAASSPAAPSGRSDWTPMAASLLVVLGLMAGLAANTDARTYVTRTGEVREVVLADGSTVELNARTTLEVEIDGDERRAHLTGGDAVFHVAAGAQPLVVTTERGSVSARDTSFAVAEDNAGMRVSVLAGRADVTRTAPELPLTEFDGSVDFSARGEATVLESGDQLALADQGLQTSQVDNDALQRDLSWRSGYVTYQDAPLRSVVRDLRRYSPVNIHFADERLREIRVSGRYPLGDVSGLLAQLEAGGGVEVNKAGPGWVVLRSVHATRAN